MSSSYELQLSGYLSGMLDDVGVVEIVRSFMYFRPNILDFIGS